jgi:Na+/melibiose symporter-like transporter
MAVLYAYIGYNFDSLDKYSLLGLYGLTFFFSNYGPNTTVRWNMMLSGIFLFATVVPFLPITRQAKHSCSHTNLLYNQTFMLPSITFSRPIRSTLNGICAASGKIGALLGALLFLPLATWVGDAQVIKLCACVSLIGAILTFFFTGDGIDDDNNSDEGRVEGDDGGDGECQDDELTRLNSVANLIALRSQEERSPTMQKELSMPTFLDLPIELKV